jgi:hypothetical protein
MYEHYAGIVLGVLGTHLISSKLSKHRFVGFGVYLMSNLAWAVYWISVGDLVPILQYIIFSTYNVRGMLNNR